MNRLTHLAVFYFWEWLPGAVGVALLLLPWALWCVMPFANAFAICGEFAYVAVLFVAVTAWLDRGHSYPGQGY